MASSFVHSFRVLYFITPRLNETHPASQSKHQLFLFPYALEILQQRHIIVGINTTVSLNIVLIEFGLDSVEIDVAYSKQYVGYFH